MAAAILSNIRKSTPRLALEVRYNLPPNHLLVLREGLLSLTRNRYVIYSNRITKHKCASFAGHIRYWEKEVEKYNLNLEGTDKTPSCKVDSVESSHNRPSSREKNKRK